MGTKRPVLIQVESELKRLIIKLNMFSRLFEKTLQRLLEVRQNSKTFHGANLPRQIDSDNREYKEASSSTEALGIII